MNIIKPVVAWLEHRWGENRFWFFWYALPYRGVIRREVALAEISSRDHVLAIGCGSLPFTAVHVARMTGARVTAVDCDSAAVEKAQSLVARLGLAHRISVIHGDAACDPLPPADVALVALQAAPKEHIRANLRRSIPAGHGRVVYRLPRNGLVGEYGTLRYSSCTCSSARHRMPTFDRSILVSAGAS